MQRFLLVLGSLFLAVIADENNIDWDSSTYWNDGSDPYGLADANSLISLNEFFADSNDAGNLRDTDPCDSASDPESSVQLDAALDQAGVDDLVKSRRQLAPDGNNSQRRLNDACDSQNRQFRDQNELPEDPPNVAPAAEWFEKCKGTKFIFELCCLGKTFRNEPAEQKSGTIWTPRTVEKCIWVIAQPRPTHAYCNDPNNRWCCAKRPNKKGQGVGCVDPDDAGKY